MLLTTVMSMGRSLRRLKYWCFQAHGLRQALPPDALGILGQRAQVERRVHREVWRALAQDFEHGERGVRPAEAHEVADQRAADRIEGGGELPAQRLFRDVVRILAN